MTVVERAIAAAVATANEQGLRVKHAVAVGTGSNVPGPYRAGDLWLSFWDHGDASFSNLLATSRGPRWNDFEDVCTGPVEWDVAGVLSDARAKRGEAFSAAVLHAYGRDLDHAKLERVDQVFALYGDLWRSYRTVLASC